MRNEDMDSATSLRLRRMKEKGTAVNLSIKVQAAESDEIFSLFSES